MKRVRWVFGIVLVSFIVVSLCFTLIVFTNRLPGSDGEEEDVDIPAQTTAYEFVAPTATIALSPTPRPTPMLIEMPTVPGIEPGESYGITFVGQEGSADGIIPYEWQTPSEVEPRYELSVSVTEQVVQRCQYSAIGSSERAEVIRTQIDAEITLTDLATGEVIASDLFMGQAPSCPDRQSFNAIGSIENRGALDNIEVELWLIDALSDHADLPALPLTLRGYQFTGADYSPDGTTVVTTIHDRPGMRLWDAVTGEELLVFEDASSGTLYPRFSLDGRFIVTATCSVDNIARVWDAQTGEELLQLVGHESTVQSADFSPDGQYIVTAGRIDRTVRIWDAETGEEIRQLTIDNVPEHSAYDFIFFEATFSLDGSRIVAPSSRGVTCIWDAHTGEELLTLQHEVDQRHAAFNPDGSLIVTSNGSTINVWDAQSGEELFSLGNDHTGDVLDVTFSPNGRFIIVPTNSGTVRIIDVLAGTELYRLVDYNSAVGNAAVSPDGSTILLIHAMGDKRARARKLPDLSDVP